MADLSEVVRNRRMSRSFTTEEVDPAAIERIISLASRAPSAGKAQGWHVVSLVGDETASYWDATLLEQRRDDFTWPGLLRAPVILVLVADPDASVERYGESDKAHTGLGTAGDAWPVPYWFVDGGAAVMALLLEVEARSLGALLFGLFGHPAIA